MAQRISSPTFNLAAYVLAAGAATPSKVALSCVSREGSEVWTYAQLIAAVRGTASGLLARGLQPGDAVLMRLGNTPDFPIAYLGAIAAGCVPVPTSAALTEAETAQIISALRPKAVLHDPRVPCPAHPEIVTQDALRDMARLPPAPWHLGDAERPAYIIYTSGTSEVPNAVVHAHRAITARQMMFDGWYGLREDDRMLHAGAFNWTYTLGTGLMDPWTLGATALIPVPGTPAADLPHLMAQHRATIFAAAPGVYRQMLKSGAALDLPHLRHGLSAGEKMSRPLRDAWRAATGRPVFEAFGMSECSTFISGSPSHPVAGDAVGRAQPGRQVAIVDDSGPLPDGAIGTIAIHRSDPGVMLGYHNAPELTAARYQGDWFVTGDQGVRDKDGQITYLGRMDDMMNAGGFRVSPLEVEAALATLEGITSVGVTQIEVKQGVRIIAAFYTGPAPLDEDALRRYAQEKLARYKQPRAYVHLEALPQGANGKLQRRALRAAFKGYDHG
jgi:acyl-coenzyme A synthetase/AMP-(fatty) acid ligase